MKEQGSMRLADRILSGCKLVAAPGTAGEVVIKTPRDSISECEVIEITPVADLFHESVADTDKVPFEAFPNIAPPFPKFFVEMKAHPTTGFQQTGVFFASGRCSRQEAEDEYRNSAAAKRGLPIEWIPGVVSPEEDVWMLQAIAIGYFSHNSGSAVPILYTSAIISMRGQLASRYNPCWGLTDQTLLTASALEGFNNRIINPAYFALSFLHCRNVQIIERAPDTKLSKAFQRRHGRPLITYKILEIEPMKRVLETEGDIAHNGLKKALHICRGHFATYSPDAPLFGRVTGTFWKPAHVRGKASEGIVHKDYKVNAPFRESL